MNIEDPSPIIFGIGIPAIFGLLWCGWRFFCWLDGVENAAAVANWKAREARGERGRD